MLDNKSTKPYRRRSQCAPHVTEYAATPTANCDTQHVHSSPRPDGYGSTNMIVGNGSPEYPPSPPIGLEELLSPTAPTLLPAC
ncbi:hypothetical protein PSHT_11392 [Puccinia striiformis]|uniref:Uncharacterized protein n=1 Tax=Puccinia striiformis TaxID=27350 RepID=A0A2S4V3Z8_9BASI|nr:hypothetical protein PSHT_11392 [Puccinia striiformis]